MTINEYIEKAKNELDSMNATFKENNQKDPDHWPLEMTEEEWVEQEIAIRELS